MILSMEYWPDSVVGLEGGDTNRPVCDLVIGAACEPSQEKADGRSMLAEYGVSFRGLVCKFVVNVMTAFSQEASLSIARVKALQYALSWLLLLDVGYGGCARASRQTESMRSE